MEMSRNEKARKSKAIAHHATHPLNEIAINNRSGLNYTAKASLSARSSIMNDRKQAAQPITHQCQQHNGDELPVTEAINTQIPFQSSPEIPMFDFRTPILSSTTTKPRSAKRHSFTQRASDSSRVYPASTQNRPASYMPTLQNGGQFPKERGNAPAGVSDEVWAKAFNAANSHIYKQTAVGSKIAVVRQARESGLTMDLAVEGLIQKGALRGEFVDA